MELHKLHTPSSRWSIEEKHQAVKLYLSGALTKTEVKNKFKISYYGLDRWINKFGPGILEENDLSCSFSDITPSRMSKDKSNQDSANELETRIKALEHELRKKNLKIELLDTMIEVAEKELNIPIRKKSGPQPSKEKRNNTK